MPQARDSRVLRQRTTRRILVEASGRCHSLREDPVAVCREGIQGTFRRSFCTLLLSTLLAIAGQVFGQSYVVVDTGQTSCYGNANVIAAPSAGQPFHGQDAQHNGAQSSFTISLDGLTVLDNNTGLTWQRSADTDGDSDVDSYDKLSWVAFQALPATLNAQNFGGFNDWRRPTVKELYSLIDFSGIDPSGYMGGTSGLTPFIDTNFFEFSYGDPSVGERIIDAQYWSSTQYVGTVFNGLTAVFGVNFADGRIKGYPRNMGPNGTMVQFARCVRGNTLYGLNNFVSNGDGTITDLATGLMWMQSDSGSALNWEQALAHAESSSLAGYADWRLPDAKELQSVVDYTRSPTTTGSPAIAPIFSCTAIIDEGGGTNYPFYWTSTTHVNMSTNPGGFGAYVCFGQGLGWMPLPFPPGAHALQDVHGAGAQRSDPKSGNPGAWPYGNGPQGDVVRIFHHVRCVRGPVPLTTSSCQLSLAAGGTQVLAFNAGASHAGAFFHLVGSLSGTQPGLGLGSVFLPLNVDPYTIYTALYPNLPPLGNSLGTLDPLGRATTTINLSAGLPSTLSGVTAHHAVVLFTPALITFASNPVPLSLVP